MSTMFAVFEKVIFQEFDIETSNLEFKHMKAHNFL